MKVSPSNDVFHLGTTESGQAIRRRVGRPAGVIAAPKFQPYNACVRDLIEVLRAHPSGRRRWSIMQAVRTNRENAGRDIPHQIEGDIERAFLEHCAGAESFKKRNLPDENAIFHWPQGKVAGVWAVFPHRAEIWMKENFPAF